ncbi:hypothetical protein VHARVF571_240015 [Vibrio harveyi]|nr:hypothetical protein VHARVF571_240015 [Vibrio harveyi]
MGIEQYKVPADSVGIFYRTIKVKGLTKQQKARSSTRAFIVN